jgi:hypothetical protein
MISKKLRRLSDHIDFVFMNPSVYLYGNCILKDGEYLIEIEGSK